MPGGGLGGRGAFVIAIVAFLFWIGSGIYFVQPDELGVVLRFGEYVRDAKPGANYHLPYPIESVVTPKVTRVNRIDIGMRVVEDSRRGGSSMRDLPEESLMLTGDENIVDVDFSVFWLIKPDKGASQYLFNIQNPEGTVKAVAESAMREVIGRSEIQPIITGARQNIEAAVMELMQKVLDRYEAGVQITQVQMQKVKPPHADDRRLPRGAGGAHRRRERPERGAGLCQPRDPRRARPLGEDRPGRRGLPRADRAGGEGPDLALPQGL